MKKPNNKRKKSNNYKLKYIIYFFIVVKQKIQYFKVSEGILLMEGEEEVLKGTKTKYFELFPERIYKQGK